MLDVSHLIGHKEWAPGRKSDPLYSMTWRRQRVAAFTPRNTTPEVDMDAAQAQQLKETHEMLQQLTKTWTTQENTKEPRAEYDVVGFARKADAYTWRMHYRQLPQILEQQAKQQVTIDKLVEIVAKGSADVAAEVRQAIADTKVQVQIVGIDGDDTTGGNPG